MLRVHPPGPKQTHGHDDHGQVLLSFGKHQILRDSGRYDYSRDPRSLYLKSAAAHSVARSSDPSKWPDEYVRGHFGTVTGGDSFRAVTSVSQYTDDNTWYRTLVVHDSGKVNVYDYWHAPEGETFELLWQVGDSVVALLSASTVTLDSALVFTLHDIVQRRNDLESPMTEDTAINPGFRSIRYAEVIDTQVVTFGSLVSKKLYLTQFRWIEANSS